jgi:hypothetical protein
VVLSWIRLALFTTRLAAARLLGYRIVWTVHQVSPHESPSPGLDHAGTWMLARMSHLLVANDRVTAVAAASRLGLARVPAVVPQGRTSVYPPGRPRDEMRRARDRTGSPSSSLSLGHLRRYKGLDSARCLCRHRESLPDAVPVVAGLPVDGSGAAEVAAAAPPTRGSSLCSDSSPTRAWPSCSQLPTRRSCRAQRGARRARSCSRLARRPRRRLDLPVYSELLPQPARAGCSSRATVPH